MSHIKNKLNVNNPLGLILPREAYNSLQYICSKTLLYVLQSADLIIYFYKYEAEAPHCSLFSRQGFILERFTLSKKNIRNIFYIAFLVICFPCFFCPYSDSNAIYMKKREKRLLCGLRRGSGDMFFSPSHVNFSHSWQYSKFRVIHF